MTKFLEVGIVLVITLATIYLSNHNNSPPEYLNVLFQDSLFKLLILLVIWKECCTITPIALAVFIGVLLHRHNSKI